jgi:hypothetical protein
MKAILLQYYKKNNSILGFQIYNDKGDIAFFQSNDFFTDDIIFNSILLSKDKIDVFYYLVSEKFFENTPNKEIFLQFEKDKKGVSLSHQKIRDNLKINVHPTSEISSYLNILSEKILHQYCKPETELPERIELVNLLTNTYNFYSEVYPNEKIAPELKKFIEQIKNFEFNNEKIEALSVFLDFLSVRKNAIFILRGSAGTGKTTLVRYFLDLYKQIHSISNYRLMAPTGKAARVLEHKTKLACDTIHRSIYTYKITTEKKYINNDVPTYISQSKEIQLNLFSDYELSHNDDYDIILNQFLLDSKEAVSFVVIDEASMVTDYRSETELIQEHEKMKKNGKRFHNCTGFHLNDIIKFLFQNNKYVKLVLVGDAYQLPPIDSGNEKFIPALDKNFITNKYSDFQIYSYQLKQSFRFANEEIYMLSLFLRNKIENAFSKGNSKINFEYNFKSLMNEFKIQHPHIDVIEYNNLHDMLVDVKNDILSGVNNTIITLKNDTSNYINNQIRYLLERNYPVVPDDKFVCTKNNYENFVMNGEQFKILKLHEVLFREVINLPLGISQIIPFFNSTIKIDNSEEIFSNILLALDINEWYVPLNISWKNPKHSLNNKNKDINFLIDREFKSRIKYRFHILVKEQMRSFINNEEIINQIIPEESCRKIFTEFDIKSVNDIDKIKIDMLINELKQDFLSFVQKNISTDRYRNSIICKYGYSITCHKSQGSEWKHVYITDINHYDLCWLYTAITRASQKVSFLYGKTDIAINKHRSKSHFRLLRSFEGEILNVVGLHIFESKHFFEFLQNCFIPSTSIVLKQESLQSLYKLDKIIMIETPNEYYYFMPDMIDFKEIEKFNNLKYNNVSIKISFSVGKKTKYSTAKVMQL